MSPSPWSFELDCRKADFGPSASVVTKPAVGFFDLANNITEGIRNTTTVFDQSSIDRVRLPRFTASDGILRVGAQTLGARGRERPC